MNEKKKIVITGANGFLGRSLARWLLRRGNEVVGLVRSLEVKENERVEGVRYERWDGETLGDWKSSFEGAEAVVNMAGRSVNCRYNDENKALILKSRTKAAEVVGEAICDCEKPPKLWVNASTATIYRDAMDRPQDDVDGERGSGFSVEVAEAWEKAFFQARVPGEVRKVATRISLVMGKEKGTVWHYFYRLAKFGLGGKMASGRQRVSWISVEDFCRAIEWFMENQEAEGGYNLAVPETPTNAEVMADFRKAAGMPIGLPSMKWMLEIGAFVMRTETELIIKSRWVRPRRLLEEGFVFEYENLGDWLERGGGGAS